MLNKYKVQLQNILQYALVHNSRNKKKLTKNADIVCAYGSDLETPKNIFRNNYLRQIKKSPTFTQRII